MVARNSKNGKVSHDLEITSNEVAAISNRYNEIAFQVYPKTNGKIQDKIQVRDTCIALRDVAKTKANVFDTHHGIENLIQTLDAGQSVHFCITNKSCKAEDIEYVDTFFGDYDAWGKKNGKPKEGVATLKELLNLPTIKKYCAFYQKSSSYQDIAPNCHFHFVYDKRIDFRSHSLAIQFVVLQLNKELAEIGKAGLFDASITSNSTHLCFSGKHECEYIERTPGLDTSWGDLVCTETSISKAEEFKLLAHGEKKEKSNKSLEPKLSTTITPKDYSGKNGVLYWIYDNLIERFDGDYTCFYDLIDHQWFGTSRSLPDGAIAQYDGMNPFSDSNSSGGSFSITAFEGGLPPTYYDRKNGKDGTLIDYYYDFGRLQGKYKHGGLEKNFKNVVNEICKHFAIPKFEWTKKKSKDEDDLSKRQALVQKLENEFGIDALRMNKMNLQPELNGEKIIFETIATQLDIEHDIVASEEMARKAILYLAYKNSYHPVQEYLEEVAAKYPYTHGMIDNISTRYFGTDNPLYDIYLRKTVIGAVARVLDPGCHLKTITILSGAQDAGKSQWIRYLTGKDWFSDNINLVDFDKDEKHKINTFWIHEISEMDKIVRKFDRANLKTNISSPSDDFRAPYGVDPQQHKRSSIFIGTTNEQQILNDPTGSVRFWCIPVNKKAGEIDLEKIISERDKIWACAYHAYKNNEQFWLTSEEEKLRDESNEDFESPDPWGDFILPYVSEFKSLPLMATYHLLNLDKNRITKVEQARIGEILRKNWWVLSSNKTKILGITSKIYLNPDSTATREAKEAVSIALTKMNISTGSVESDDDQIASGNF